MPRTLGGRRRASGLWTPFNQGNWSPLKHYGLVGWWSWRSIFSNPGGVLSTTWRDHGPNGFHMGPVGGPAPTIDTPALLGGRPSVFFPSAPGTPQAFTVAGDARAQPTASGPDAGNTLIVVCMPSTTTFSLIPFHHGTGDTAESMRLQFVNDTSLYLDPQSGGGYWQTAAGQYAANTPYIVSAATSGSTWTFRRNGTALGRAAGPGSGAPSSSASWPMSISSFGGAASLPWRGWLSEVIYWNRRMPLAEIQEIEARLGEFYRIAVA